MIEVSLVQQSDQWQFSVKGHAGYAPKGQDIVCAAASILYMTLKNGAHKQGWLMHCQEAEGDCELRGRLTDEAVTVLKVLSGAWRQLADYYPGYVCFHQS